MMKFFSFLKNFNTPTDPNAKVEEEKKAVKDWLPIQDVRDGIVHLKNGEYVKILEVVPINFKLKSKAEKKMLMYKYKSFLKGCRFPMQISVQCRKTNIEPHVNRMKAFYETEKNPSVRNMIKGYINLVTKIGTQGTITRRYYLVFPYVKPPGIKDPSYNDVLKQIKEKHALIRQYLHMCGNDILENSETEFTINVLYSYLNKRTSEIQKIGNKLLSLMGTFLDATYNDETDSEEEDMV